MKLVVRRGLFGTPLRSLSVIAASLHDERMGKDTCYITQHTFQTLFLLFFFLANLQVFQLAETGLGKSFEGKGKGII